MNDNFFSDAIESKTHVRGFVTDCADCGDCENCGVVEEIENEGIIEDLDSLSAGSDSSSENEWTDSYDNNMLQNQDDDSIIDCDTPPPATPSSDAVFIDDSDDDLGILGSSSEEELQSDDSDFDSEEDRSGAIVMDEVPIPAEPKPTKASWKKSRDSLLEKYFSQFDSTVFENALKEVPVTWNKKLLTTAGHAKLRRVGGANGVRSAAIELSEKVIDDEYRLRTTLLHEMCHAAAWIIDDTSKPAHGDVFKKWAKRGMSKTDVIVTTRHTYEIAYKFAWACQNSFCGAVIKRQSRSVDPSKHVCSACKGNLIEIESDNVASKTPKKQKKLNEYAQFVKDNTAKVRKKLGGKKASFADVTRECARLYKIEKEKKKKTAAKDDNTAIDLGLIMDKLTV